MSYPLFIPPQVYLANGPREWSKKQAQSYLQWFLAIKDKRVSEFMAFLGIILLPKEELGWNHISQQFYNIVIQESFVRKETHEDPFTKERKDLMGLTNEGYAFAGDMGLFLFSAVEKSTGRRLEWTIGKGPKGFVSHNLPVVLNKKSLQRDPLDLGIVTTQAIINGNADPSEWFRMFRSLCDTL